MDRMQVNTMRSAMIIDARVSGAGIWVCTLARRRAEAGRKNLEKRAGGGGNGRSEINVATKLITHSF